MGNLLKKELKLVTSPLTYIFLVFTLMTFVPNYPILMGSFFVCLGIFQSIQQTRVTNDIPFTALLPIAKGDVVKSKFVGICFFQVTAFILTLIFSVIRMTKLMDSPMYEESFLMNANFVFLGFSLLIYLMFNLVFIRGFFKTAYHINKPYILFVIVSIIIIGIGEVLHFLPNMRVLNEYPSEGHASVQILFFVICLILYIAGTWFAYRSSRKRLEKLDL